MKRTLFQLLNLLMAFVVLMSSTGFGLVEHSCQMRGKQKTVVVAFTDVKPQKDCGRHGQSTSTNQTSLKEADCCQEDQRYENVDVTSSLSQLVAKFVKTVTEAVLSAVTTVLAWLVDWVFDRQTSAALTAFLSPPSLSGRDILTLVQTFLL